jgi:tRNA dimethylallyltransferase
MIEEGLVDEVRGLLPYRNHNALQTVGYKEIFEYLDGKTSLDEAITNIKTNTRRYAKRQLTWFRKDPSIEWTDPEKNLNFKS